MNTKNALNDDVVASASGGSSAANLKIIGTATVITTHLNIRYDADKNSQWLGETNAPAKYDVYSIVQNQGFIWYQIALHKWIANDGTWVSFSTK